MQHWDYASLPAECPILVNNINKNLNINLGLCNENYVFVSAFNVNRLRTHFNQVAREISIESYDIVCIGETFLKPDNPNDDVNINGYNLIRSDRILRDRGG